MSIVSSDRSVTRSLRLFGRMGSDTLMVVACAVASVTFLVASGWYWTMSKPLRYGTRMHASANQVTGPHADMAGIASCQIELVEFGDYECPPCRRAAYWLEGYLKQHPNSVRFEFRNYPLTAIHPYAYDAAVLAEIARQNGDFWPVHSALYSTYLNPKSLDTLSRRFKLDQTHTSAAAESIAKSSVDRDVRAARALGISGTPAFFVCYKSGLVVRLRSIEDLPLAVADHN